ncbi:IS5 family transposase ISAmi2 [Nocardiopsis dassonvillei]
MDIQIVSAPDGEPVWTSWSLPGTVHDTRAARIWQIAERIEAAGFIGLGDKGYVGLAEVVFCPFKGRGKLQWKRDANSVHAKLRAPGERAIAQLKNWTVLRRLRCCPH